VQLITAFAPGATNSMKPGGVDGARFQRWFWGYRLALLLTWALLALCIVCVVIDRAWSTHFRTSDEPSTKVCPVGCAEGILIAHFSEKVLNPLSVLNIFKPYLLSLRLEAVCRKRLKGKLLTGKHRSLLDNRRFGGINDVGVAQNVVFWFSRFRSFCK